MKRPGLFITLEGIDGAGKSTHADALARALQDAGHTVQRTREPGGTPLAEQLRQLALNSQGAAGRAEHEMDGLTEALLMFAARRDHVRQLIAPALAAGRLVLCDRFTDATFAYQGGGRGLPWSALQEMERLALGDAGVAEGQTTPLRPDLTLWFDLPPEVAAQRLAHARLPDRFERQPVAFFAAVRSAYARRMAEDESRFARIDAAQSVHAVRQAALAALQQRGWLA